MQEKIHVIDLIDELDKAARLSMSTPLDRLMNNPLKYFRLLINRYFIYPVKKSGSIYKTHILNHYPFYVALPSGADIFLLGTKSHESEVRLSRFLLNHLPKNATFLDIGAHFGYYSVLAALKTGEHGKVVALEPGNEMFDILTKNTVNLQQISACHIAASDKSGMSEFFTYPNKYNEYSSLKKNPAAKEIQATSDKIATVRLDEWFVEKNFFPDYIKIDVEGSEYDVLKGMGQFLSEYNPVVVIEYFPESNDTNYQKALEFMLSKGYKAHIILEDGSLFEKKRIEEHFKNMNKKSSDNIAFKK